jgi:hypothetical protein
MLRLLEQISADDYIFDINVLAVVKSEELRWSITARGAFSHDNGMLCFDARFNAPSGIEYKVEGRVTGIRQSSSRIVIECTSFGSMHGHIFHSQDRHTACAHSLDGDGITIVIEPLASQCLAVEGLVHAGETDIHFRGTGYPGAVRSAMSNVIALPSR